MAQKPEILQQMLYCRKFNNPDIDTPQKMQAFVKDKLKSMGFPGFLAGFLLKYSFPGTMEKSDMVEFIIGHQDPPFCF